MVDGPEAVDCFDPWHAQHGSPAREHGRGQCPTRASGPSRDRDGLLPDRDLWWPHGCDVDGADWPGLTRRPIRATESSRRIGKRRAMKTLPATKWNEGED